jgi:hypothetical protein
VGRCGGINGKRLMVLRLRSQAPGIKREPKCAGLVLDTGDDPFFSEDPEETDEAIDFCNGTSDGVVCPIRHECLMFALLNNERFGVWGGMSEIGRKAIRKKHPLENRKQPREEWHWQTEEEALKGLDRNELLREMEEDV